MHNSISSIPGSSYLTIDVKKLLKFFDKVSDENKGHATSLASIAGEDLGAGLFKHYLEKSRTARVEILRRPPTPGTRKGARLDRWIDVSFRNKRGVLYQTEIKSWSAHAIGGKDVPLKCSEKDMKKHRLHYWRMVWNDDSKYPKYERLSKVLFKMKRPNHQDLEPTHTIRPLLILWYPLHPHGANECFFTHNVRKMAKHRTGFRRVWFFSVSTYLRSLRSKKVRIYAPHLIARLGWMKELFSSPV